MNTGTPNSRILRLGRVSEPYNCYSVTKNVQGRRKVLTSPQIADILTDSWNYLRKTEQFKILSFCIMPDHYHLLFVLLDSGSLSKVLNCTSKFTAREINRHEGNRGRFWQDGFYDRRLRNENDANEMSNYIEHNPVRQGLAEFAEEWKFSSAHETNAWLLDRDWYSQAR